MAVNEPAIWPTSVYANFVRLLTSTVAIIRVCDLVWFCLSISTIRPKRLKLKSLNLAQGYLAHQLILGQKSKVKVTGSQSAKSYWRRSSGRRELYTLSSAQPLVGFNLIAVSSMRRKVITIPCKGFCCLREMFFFNTTKLVNAAYDMHVDETHLRSLTYGNAGLVIIIKSQVVCSDRHNVDYLLIFFHIVGRLQ